MSGLTRAIQGMILFCTLFGVAFLYEVYPVLPSFVFDAVAFGWVLFVVDSALTFVRPNASYYLGLVLAVVAFGATVSQPEHYALIASGDVAATVTIIVGSAAEVILAVLVILFVLSGRKGDPWAWPGKPESEAGPAAA
ncbi:MAG TPA: hypothetical protein VJR06_06520 [Nitrososphaerales archaeon]|nr:hypothetical protein [Nitrososphaerales archaeon]